MAGADGYFRENNVGHIFHQQSKKKSMYLFKRDLSISIFIKLVFITLLRIKKGWGDGWSENLKFKVTSADLVLKTNLFLCIDGHPIKIRLYFKQENVLMP